MTDNTVVRRHYSAGGQSVALRVSGHPTPANNGLFFTIADHPTTSLRAGLGSASVLSDSSGVAVTGSDTRYPSTPAFGLRSGQALPFGDYRQAPTTNPDLTERGYTGHKHNDSLGLIYMNARYYVPNTNRFASAETIVRAPAIRRRSTPMATSKTGFCFSPIPAALSACPALSWAQPGGLLWRTVYRWSLMFTVATASALS